MGLTNSWLLYSTTIGLYPSCLIWFVRLVISTQRSSFPIDRLRSSNAPTMDLTEHNCSWITGVCANNGVFIQHSHDCCCPAHHAINSCWGFKPFICQFKCLAYKMIPLWSFCIKPVNKYIVFLQLLLFNCLIHAY